MSRLQKLLGVGKGYLERLPPVDVHKLLRLILLNLPYIMIFYVGNKLAWLYQYCAGNSMIERLIVLVLNFQLAFSRILPSMHKNELLVGLTGAVGVKLMVYERQTQESEICKEQERDRNRRIWFRKDPVLCKTKSDADGKIYQLCGHGPQGNDHH